MRWTKITIDTTTEAVDMISYALGELGVEGIEVEDKIPLSEADKKAMYIDILPDNIPEDDGLAKISCYIEEDTDIRDVNSLIGKICKELSDISEYINIGSGKITIDETEDKDWINNWKAFFKPFRLEDNIVIKPTWEELTDVKEDDIVINIDPGTAFGTGSHNTTKLCIGQLKKYIKQDESTIFDVGCGSGILSIIALKLGAKSAYGVDIDENATRASIENMEINNISSDIMEVAQGDVIGDKEFTDSIVGEYDIVVANILADVIIPLSKHVKPFMKEDGVFITSGIINTKEEAVKNALIENEFNIIDTVYMGEWVSVVAKK